MHDNMNDVAIPVCNASVKRYQLSAKIGRVFQVVIAVQLQYCDNGKFSLYN